jgi:hypothetical protein
MGRRNAINPANGGISVALYPVPRAKIWLDSTQHLDNPSRWERVAVGQKIAVGVIYGGDGRLHVNEMWSGTGRTTVHGRLVGIEWHAITGDEIGPGMAVESIQDVSPETPDYEFELTVATSDWLPH